MIDGGVSVPSDADRHLLRRFSYGVNRELVLQSEASGGARAWFEKQLFPANIPDPLSADMLSWYPRLNKTPQQMWSGFQAGTFQEWEVMADFQAWSLMRRTFSQRQLLETMVEFWGNVFHVPTVNKLWPTRKRYDDVLRTNALGRFDQLLQSTVLNEGMLLYLDNYCSTAEELNENLGRELLELHTVGIEANYTEEDVKNSARILTGWTADRARTWVRSYDTTAHYRGPVSVMGFSDPNSAADGRAMSKRYLSWLAHHPATARRVAQRLAVRFVSDSPSQALIDATAAAFVASGTDIRTTLRAMVTHPDFAAASDSKVTTPTEDIVASLRAMRVRPAPPTGTADDMQIACLWQATSMGQVPYDWPTPDGFPDTAGAWSSVSRMLGSWDVHHSLACSARPSKGVVYRPTADWWPVLPAPFSEVVDHMSRLLLGRPATSGLVSAACIAADVAGPGVVINRDSPFIRFNRTPLVLSALLDSPMHMTR